MRRIDIIHIYNYIYVCVCWFKLWFNIIIFKCFKSNYIIRSDHIQNRTLQGQLWAVTEHLWAPRSQLPAQLPNPQLFLEEEELCGIKQTPTISNALEWVRHNGAKMTKGKSCRNSAKAQPPSPSVFASDRLGSLSHRIQFENELLPTWCRLCCQLLTHVGTLWALDSLACRRGPWQHVQLEMWFPDLPDLPDRRSISIPHGPEIAVAANSCVALSVGSCNATILFPQCVTDSRKTMEEQGPGGCLCFCVTSIHEYHELSGIKHQSYNGRKRDQRRQHHCRDSGVSSISKWQ